MSESNDLTFATQSIEFEPSTGYVGTALDSMPEPVTAILINGYIKVDPNNRVIEGFWLKAFDESAMLGEPQPIMHSFEFMQVSRLCAAVFAACGRTNGEETRVGLGYTAYHNELARRLDPSLPEGPVRNLACTVSGFANRGVNVCFATADSSPLAIACVQGCLSPQGMHTLARGFRDMADWRASALEQASIIIMERRAEARAAKEATRSSGTRRSAELASTPASGPRR